VVIDRQIRNEQDGAPGGAEPELVVNVFECSSRERGVGHAETLGGGDVQEHVPAGNHHAWGDYGVMVPASGEELGGASCFPSPHVTARALYITGMARTEDEVRGAGKA
jgi:hypothetical protein